MWKCLTRIKSSYEKLEIENEVNNNVFNNLTATTTAINNNNLPVKSYETYSNYSDVDNSTSFSNNNKSNNEFINYDNTELTKSLKKDKEQVDMISSQYMFFHADIKCRNHAETKLKESGSSKDGVFLIRHSTSSDDFVISFTFKQKILHYQIHLTAGLYQLDGCISPSCQNLKQGLNGLVDTHKKVAISSTTILTEGCSAGQPPPPLTFHTGLDNSLHKAVQEGYSERALKILLHPLCPHLDCINSNGSTVLHLASERGLADVVNVLLLRGATVGVANSDGLNCLHLACKFNHWKVIFLLLCQGHVNPQTPTHTHGDTPLHVATKECNVEAVQELLKWNVACFPRNNEQLTPYETALRDGFDEGVKLFDEYKVPPAKTQMQDWFHSKIKNRNEALVILQPYREKNGYFFIRKHTSEDQKYVLDVCFHDTIHHFVIETCMLSVFISGGTLLASLEHLVEYYSTYQDSMPGLLSTGINDFGELIEIAKHTLPFQDKNYNSTKTQKVSKLTDPIELNPENLEIGAELGKGEYGSVKKGKWKLTEKEVLPVAIKSLHEENTRENYESFLSEAKIVGNLSHPCIVDFFGICFSPNLMLVQEFMSMGSLLDFLLDKPEKVDAVLDIPLWAEQISCGMVYLEREGLVHRDLATRNILLSTKDVAKISDFGLSRVLSTKDYYKANKGGKWPIKWYAPESVLFGTFSSLSDVWSFGVTLWEMYSLGDQPYDEMTGAQVLAFLESGGRLESPQVCPGKMKQLMLHCWNISAKLRPTFEKINYNIQAFRLENSSLFNHCGKDKISKNKKKIFGLKLF